VTATRAARPRRQRSTTEALVSIALGLEAAAAIFVMIAVFALKALDPLPAFLGGGVLILLFLLAAGVQRWTWGVWFGGALQVVLIASGFVLPVLFLVGVGFAALWLWCLVRAKQIERARREYLSSHPEGGETAADPTAEGAVP